METRERRVLDAWVVRTRNGQLPQRFLGWMLAAALLLPLFPQQAVAVDWNSSAYRGDNLFYNAGYAPARFYPSGISPKLGSAKGNCTWYAHGRVRELGYRGTALNAMSGNASQWASQASGRFTVNQTPAAGAIAQSTAYRAGYGQYGHVAVVERVNSDGTVLISESSYAPGTAWDFEYRTRTVPQSNFNNYIHVIPPVQPPPTTLGIGWWGPYAKVPVLACEDVALWTKVTPVSSVGSVWYEADYFGSSHGVGQPANTDADNFRYYWWPPINTSMRVNLRAVAFDKASNRYTNDYTRYFTEELYSVAGDFTGNGIDDVVRLVAVGGDTQLWLFRSDGQRFSVANAKTLGQWGRIYTKATAGDVDGDGIDELLLFTTGTEDNFGKTCALHVVDFASGSVSVEKVWEVSSGWSWERVKPVCGDIDGDGKDELIGMYDYDGWDGIDTGMWVWHFDSDSVSVKREWTATGANYDWNSSNFFCGDFDGDGQDELGSYYRYGDHKTGWWIFKRSGSGSWTSSRPWYVDSGWEFGSTKPAVGDFDGDGRDEVANFYNYKGWGGFALGTWIMELQPGGGVINTRTWTTPTDSWDWVRVRPLAGDFDGDGKDELAAFYDYHWNAETTEAWGLFMWQTEWSWANRKIWNKTGGAWPTGAPALSDTFANTPPVASNDTYEMPFETALSVPAPGVLANDTDADGDLLTAHLLTNVSNGTLVLSADGGFLYTPDPGFSGTDTFTYRAHDGEDFSNIATVTITVVADVTPPDPPPVITIAGTNRYVTAVRASREAYPLGTDTVVIATGRNWPDALGGSALAGALDAPILLVPGTSVPDIVSAEIERLEATKAVIVGGPLAVGSGVMSTLRSQLGHNNVERVDGANRYETAEKVALRTIALLEAAEGYDGTAFVATGGAYADAVAAAPLAALQGWPLFLAHPSAGMRPATLAAMADISEVLVLGGDLAVSPVAYTQLTNVFGSGSVERLGGATRYATAVAIATHGVQNAGLSWNRVGIATGQAYPDALAGGVLQGKVGSVMLLTRTASLPEETAQALADNTGAISTVTYFGGELAVSAQVRSAVAQIFR